MSNTYGSIHIQTRQSESVVQMILGTYEEQPNSYDVAITVCQQRNLYVNPEFLALMKRLYQLEQENFIVTVSNGWVSLYDEQMSLEEVTKKARSFAKKTQEPIIYISCFDGDVFVFGLIENGKTKTSGRACAAPDVYDMTEKQAKMAEFYRVTGASMPEKRMKMPSDVTELENLLSSIMPVPLIVYDEDAFKSLAEEYELSEEVRGIRVFKVKYKK